jgi:acyl carrier protein
MDKFLEHIAEIFENTPKDQISLNSKFKSFDEWDSLMALSLIAMFDSEYNVKLSGDQIRTANTLDDLYKQTL